MMFPSELPAFHVVAQSGVDLQSGRIAPCRPSSVSRKIVPLEQQIGTACWSAHRTA
jgi:hypothetical protein